MNCAAAGRGPDHADGLVAGLQHGLEGIDDRRPHRHGPHVDVMVDRRRQVGAGEQAALLPHLDGDRAGADAVENLPRQRIRHHARGRGVQHQRGGIGRREAVVEPVHAEIGDRRHVDHQPGDHDQRDGEQQQLAGQAEPARRGPVWIGRGAGIVGWSSVTDTKFALISSIWRATGPKPASSPLDWYLPPDLRGCVPPRSRSNYRSLMSAGSDVSSGESPSCP